MAFGGGPGGLSIYLSYGDGYFQESTFNRGATFLGLGIQKVNSDGLVDLLVLRAVDGALGVVDTYLNRSGR